MTINIDFNLIKKLNISAQQFIILYLLYKKDIIELNAYLTLSDFKYFEEDYNDLVTLDYLEKLDPFNKYDLRALVLTDKTLEVFEEFHDYFDDFLEVFPDKGGTRYLKSAVSKARAKYLKITNGKRYLHKHIMKCLEFEINHRQITNQQQYMKTILNWLESEEWKAYEKELLNKNNMNTSKQYGAELE